LPGVPVIGKMTLLELLEGVKTGTDIHLISYYLNSFIKEKPPTRRNG
jgi:hypothetical protein